MLSEAGKIAKKKKISVIFAEVGGTDTHILV